MSTKPLDYESLKCVIQYMDINMRIQIARRCPSIRRTEKIVPVHIQDLKLRRRMIVMNGTSYILGIHRKYHDGKPPKSIQEMNETGGVWRDIDQYGFEDDSGEGTVTPGDVVLRDPKDQQVMVRRVNNDEQVSIERAIKSFENEIERRKGSGNTGEQRSSLQCVPDEELEKHLERNKTRMLSYYYRRDQVSPPYDTFIQLTIRKEGSEEQRVEFYQYNKKYHVAMKQLSTLLFGERRSCITVHELRIDARIVRLPLGVKFKIQNLVLRVPAKIRVVHNALSHVLEPSSFPLCKLDMNLNNYGGDYTFPMIQDAKCLIVSNILHWDLRNLDNNTF